MAIPSDPSNPPWSDMSKVLRALSASDIMTLSRCSTQFLWEGLDFNSLARARLTTYIVNRYYPAFEEKDVRSAVSVLAADLLRHAMEVCNDASSGSAGADQELLTLLAIKAPPKKKSANPAKNQSGEMAAKLEQEKMKKLQKQMDQEAARM